MKFYYLLQRVKSLLISGILFFGVLIPAVSFCSENDIHAIGVKQSGLQWLNWAVIAVYALFMLGTGLFYLHKQKNTEDYLLGGRKINPVLSGISLFATLLSSISYLGVPGETIKHGPVFFAVFLFAVIIVYFIVAYVIIPIFMRLQITSAYEVLEKPLGVGVRLFGAIIFILTRITWMALLIFLTAKVMVVMMNWDTGLIPVITVVVGIITLIYCTMGGLRAVIITDVTQSTILFFGALLTIFLISVKMGGPLNWIPTSWAPNWDNFVFFSFDPLVRITVLGTMVYWIVWWTCTAGSDQMAIQRYIATRDVKAARQAFLTSIIVDVVITSLLMLTGFALLGFFRTNPHLLAEGKSITGDTDFLFPHYIANLLPVGITGLVVAGLLAAAMSSLSSGINSIAAVLMSDFVDRFKKHKITETQHVRVARYISFFVGVIVVLISSLAGKVPGNIMEVTTKTNGLFVAPLFNLFFMALFIPFATPFGAIIGTIYGFYSGLIFAFWDVITGQPGLSFWWIYPISLTTSIVCSILFSLLPTRDKSTGIKLLWSILLIIPLALILVFLIN